MVMISEQLLERIESTPYRQVCRPWRSFALSIRDGSTSSDYNARRAGQPRNNCLNAIRRSRNGGHHPRLHLGKLDKTITWDVNVYRCNRYPFRTSVCYEPDRFATSRVRTDARSSGLAIPRHLFSRELVLLSTSNPASIFLSASKGISAAVTFVLEPFQRRQRKASQQGELGIPFA
jgi:hypothetical protein